MTAILRRSRSVKITDFGTNGKPVCDFLIVNNALILTYILSRTVSKLSRIIVQIFAVEWNISL